MCCLLLLFTDTTGALSATEIGTLQVGTVPSAFEGEASADFAEFVECQRFLKNHKTSQYTKLGISRHVLQG